MPWWRKFGRSGLASVVLLRHTWPIAFLPFYTSHEPPHEDRRLLLLGVGPTDYLDGVFSPHCRVEHVNMALGCVLSTDGWDSMVAVQLRQTSKLFKAMRHEDRRGLESFRSESCLRIRIAPIGELPQKTRENIYYDRSRAERGGKLELELADRGSWRAAFDELVEMHEVRWRAIGQPDLWADPRVIAFHREAIPLLLDEGLLRLHLLRWNGEPIAAAYSLLDPANRRERTQYLYLITHARAHAELHPGTLLLAAMVEQAAEEGVMWIDLLRGEQSYRTIWHAEQEPTFGFALS